MPRDGLDNRMNRRRLLQTMSALPFIGSLFSAAANGARAPVSRVRPGDQSWPSDKAAEELGRRLEGRLIMVSSPLAACVGAPSSDACAYLAKEIKNPYYLGGEVGLTQTLGWVGAHGHPARAKIDRRGDVKLEATMLGSARRRSAS